MNSTSVEAKFPIYNPIGFQQPLNLIGSTESTKDSLHYKNQVNHGFNGLGSLGHNIDHPDFMIKEHEVW